MFDIPLYYFTYTIPLYYYYFYITELPVHPECGKLSWTVLNKPFEIRKLQFSTDLGLEIPNLISFVKNDK